MTHSSFIMVPLICSKQLINCCGNKLKVFFFFLSICYAFERNNCASRECFFLPLFIILLCWESPHIFSWKLSCIKMHFCNILENQQVCPLVLIYISHVYPPDLLPFCFTLWGNRCEHTKRVWETSHSLRNIGWGKPIEVLDCRCAF